MDALIEMACPEKSDKKDPVKELEDSVWMERVRGLEVSAYSYLDKIGNSYGDFNYKVLENLDKIKDTEEGDLLFNEKESFTGDCIKIDETFKELSISMRG